MKILLIEDDENIVEYIKMAFTVASPETVVISTGWGEDGINMVESESPDIVILDLGLPDIDGFEVLKRIRLFSKVPVIIVTVRSEEANIVKGLQLGADEYLIKPFGQMELLARIRTLMKRFHNDITLPYYFSKNFQFGYSMNKIHYHGKEINLTQTEGVILYHLMENAGKVVTHRSLAETVWGEDYPGSQNAIKVYIRRLRQKLEYDPEKPRLIQSSKGKGYLIIKSEE